MVVCGDSGNYVDSSFPMPARAPPRLAVIPSTTLRMGHPTPPMTSISVPGSIIILGSTRDLITLLCPSLACPRLRFVPWSLPLDPFFPPFFLRGNNRDFEVFLCDASSDLGEVDLSLCSDLELSSSSFMETLTVLFAKPEVSRSFSSPFSLVCYYFP